MFGVTGAGLSTIRYYSNNKKAPRRTLDAWDRQSQPTSNHSIWDHPLIIRPVVMDRDFRLTGIWREQTDNPIAPVGFEVNNPWRVCRSLLRSRPSLKLYRWKKGSFEPLQNSIPSVHISLVSIGRINFYSQDQICFAMIDPATMKGRSQQYHKPFLGHFISEANP